MMHLRRSQPNARRPFKAPFSIKWLSITGLIGLVSSIALLTQFGFESVILGLSLPISGCLVFYLLNK